MSSISKYFSKKLLYSHNEWESIGSKHVAGLLQSLHPEHVKILDAYYGKEPIAVCLLSIREFFLRPRSLDIETGLALSLDLKREAESKIEGFMPESTLLFAEHTSLHTVCLAAAMPKGKKLVMSDAVVMLRLSIRDNLHLSYFDELKEFVHVSAGVGFMPDVRQRSLENMFFSALWEAESALNNPMEYAGLPVFEEYERILEEEDISTLYQPVVSFESGNVIGWEAFSVGPKGSFFHTIASLLRFAEETGTLADLESLCRKKAFEGAGKLKTGQKLFINMHPAAFMERFTPGETLVLLEKAGIRPSDVVLEISEPLTSKEPARLLSHLEKFSSRGFNLCLDELGNQLSNLGFMTRLKADYMKVDISLIGGIDSNPYNRQTVETLVAMANRMDSRLIAVGVETETEYHFLSSMAIYAGQGHYLAAPSSVLSEEVFVPQVKASTEAIPELAKSAMPIRDLVRPTIQVTEDTTVQQVKELLADKPPVSNVVIVKDRKPLGLIMKYTLDYHLSSQFGISLYLQRPASRIMDGNVLTVEAGQPVEEVAQLAMQRENEKIYDDLLVTDKGALLGVVSVQRLLDSLAKFQVEMAKGANPLSGLPGNVAIETEIERRSKGRMPTSLVYIDLDNFKVYNDVYGFDNGDKVILLTARALNEANKRKGGLGDMVGHVGGDDFVLIVDPQRAQALAEETISLFAKEAPALYNEEDRTRGYIVGAGRDGKKGKFSLVSLSIAIIDCVFDDGFTMGNLSLTAAVTKKKAKAIDGNSIARQCMECTNAG